MKETTEKKAEVIVTETKLERKVQLSLRMLKTLAENKKLLDAFLEITETMDDVKAPMAFQMAKREVTQLKITQ